MVVSCSIMSRRKLFTCIAHDARIGGDRSSALTVTVASVYGPQAAQPQHACRRAIHARAAVNWL